MNCPLCGRKSNKPLKGTQKVTFRATKIAKKPVKVSFKTSSGQKVEFKAKKDVPKRVHDLEGYYCGKKNCPRCV